MSPVFRVLSESASSCSEQKQDVKSYRHHRPLLSLSIQMSGNVRKAEEQETVNTGLTTVNSSAFNPNLNPQPGPAVPTWISLISVRSPDSRVTGSSWILQSSRRLCLPRRFCSKADSTLICSRWSFASSLTEPRGWWAAALKRRFRPDWRTCWVPGRTSFSAPPRPWQPPPASPSPGAAASTPAVSPEPRPPPAAASPPPV